MFVFVLVFEFGSESGLLCLGWLLFVFCRGDV